MGAFDAIILSMKRHRKAPLPSPERVREAFDYDPETGVLTWRICTSNRAPAGREAGSPDGQGYRILMLDGVLLRTHRVAWAHFHGTWPDHFIDHINGNRSDNRIANLRDVPNAVNLQNNAAPQCNNTSGFKGVWLDKRRNRYVAELQAFGKRHRLGSFRTPEEAYAVYLEAKQRFHAPPKAV